MAWFGRPNELVARVSGSADLTKLIMTAQHCNGCVGRVLAKAVAFEDGILDPRDQNSNVPELLTTEILAEQHSLRILSDRRYLATHLLPAGRTIGIGPRTKVVDQGSKWMGIFFIFALIALLLYFF